jgi:putative ABC transport system permease protein
VVDLALKNLLHDKLRFAITVAGVAFAVTLVLVQTGLFFGLLAKATVTIEHLDADLWVTSRNTPNIDFAHTFPETYVQRVRSVPGVARADNLIVTFLPVTLPTGAQENVVMYALEDPTRWGFPWRVLEGKLANLRRGKYIFLDDYANRRFGSFAIGEYREIRDTRLKIIGRTKDALSFTTTPLAFASYEVAQSLSPDLLRGKTTYIVVKLDPGADAQAVRGEIARRLPYNDVHTRAEWMAKSRRYWVANTGIGINMRLTVFLGCLVGVVVVAQTLYTSVIEHLKEFATVKAIGGANADIYLIVGKQAVMAAVVGFLLGCIPAVALQPAVRSLDLELLITADVVAAVFLGTLALCLAAAMLSFHKVAGADPAMVFRT